MDLPETLKEKLAARRVIPFIGAGVSMVARRKRTDERLFPSWTELLSHTADRLVRENKQHDADYIRAGLNLSKPDYLAMASHAKDSLGPVWAPFLKEEFNHSLDSVCENSLALPKLIWQLGSRLIITTNYDKVLRWSCPSAGDCETWNIEHKAELAQFLGRQDAEKPTVWHLHGSIEDASRIILTRDGYKLLYADDNTKGIYDAALQTLRSVLSSHTILFIGCSFSDEQLGMQIQGVDQIFDGFAGPHYALIREDEKSRLHDLKLPIQPLTFSDFGQPLLDLLEKLTQHATGGSTPTTTIAPSASDDPAVATSPAKPNYHPSNAVFHVPFAQKGSQVIGRDEALLKVRQQLVEGRRTAIGHTASFQGLGGLGKTQLAVEYAYQYRDSYPNGIIWLCADQDIDAQLTELAVTAEWMSPDTEHKDKLAVAKQRLRSYGNCLIIFDNLEDQGAIRSYLPNPGVTSHILVTSRTEQPGFTPIPLDPLNPDHSLELLYQDACRMADSPAEESAALEIVTILGGLPLAIELAGAYLCHRRAFTFTDYLTRLKDDPLKALLERYLSSFTGHDPDLYRTLKINEELFAEEPLLTPILDLLTWSGPASMGVDLMAHLLDKPSTELRGAMALGVELRIVQKTPDVDRYAIHRLVREVRKVESPLSGRMDWVENIADRLGDWFQALREDFKELPRFEAEIDHLIAWCDNVCELPLLNARLTWLQAYPPYHRGNYQSAHDIVKLALLMINEGNSETNELNANIFNDFGATLEFFGDYKNSLRYKKRALAIRKELFGDDHPDTTASYNNVGCTCGELGDFEKAIEFQQKALDINHALLGDSHPNTAISYNNVGGSYGEMGNNKKALEFEQKALNITHALFGDDHPNTAALYNNVGGTYGKLGDFQKALEFQQKALGIRRDLFGDDHPDTASSYNNVGGIYRLLGENKNALAFQQKALDIRHALFGDDHPKTASSYKNVGGTYCALGDYKKAFDFEQKALNIRRAIFGDDHLDIVDSLYSIGNIHYSLGNRQIAADALNKALRTGKRILPDASPLIKNIEESLRIVLSKAKGFRTAPRKKKRR